MANTQYEGIIMIDSVIRIRRLECLNSDGLHVSSGPISSFLSWGTKAQIGELLDYSGHNQTV